MIADWLHHKADYVMIQEAHVNNNRAAFLRSQLANSDVEIFWTGDKVKPKSTGGVILIVRRSFLGQFEYQEELRNVNTKPGFKGGLESAMGHAIGLRLQSKLKGDLDIWAIYAPSDNSQHRRRLWNTVAGHMNKNSLNVMAGDFNFVESNGDRYYGVTQEFTGQADAAEARQFRQLIADPRGLVEIEQGMHTKV